MKVVDHEFESVTEIECVIGDDDHHALHAAFGHRADPVRGSVLGLGVQPLIFEILVR